MTGGGFRTFSGGQTLTAADVQDFLMDQAVMNFAGTAARGSALPTPSEGMVAHIGGGSLTVWDGSAWLNVFPIGTATGNLIINGAMQVAQRGTSTTGITGDGYYTADRWRAAVGSMGTWTQTSENDAPTGSGFRKSTKLLCTTADSTPAAGDFFLLEQRLEGQDLQRIKKGTSAAEQLTLSFWVKSNVTGTYVLQLRDNDNTRSVGAQYTISASGTWEKKTVTFPADTTGAFDNDNAESLRVRWWLGGGSSFTSGTLNTTWASETAANIAVGQTNLAAATNNYWQITGVQLEVGNTATGFEFESFETTLRKCQRYYCKTFPLNTAPAHNLSQNGSLLAPIASGTGLTAYAITWTFPVSMRAAPTITTFTPSAAGAGGWYDQAAFEVAAGIGNISSDAGTIYNSGAAVVGRNAAIHAVAEIEL